ncbi:unnamed protein product [Prunus armeniaca]|uniref:Germin-like protein n=1 Tax=Prunus armeniaca TaxID=36596 RepID=A0A6J5WCH7_PRUAR|nr:unnamed protein product [Prunus armeniaca]
MKGVHFLISTLAILASATFLVSASDPSPLQDFCVALDDTKSAGGYFGAGAVFVNGKFCKDPKLVNANDFFFSGLQNPRNTQNPLGFKCDNYFAPNGLNPPHTHPRASEFLVVLEGSLYVGFVTSNGDGNRLFTKVLNKGDVFVFPIGLIHFQFNVGHVNAVAFAGLSSQNPGVITIANAVFGSKPLINPDVLAKAFQVDNNVVDYLQKQFWYDNN